MKVLVTDFDKTFYKNKNDLKINKELIKEFRSKGNLFIFATGRSESSFFEQKKKYDLEYDYVILNHGAIIANQKGDIMAYNTVDKEIIKNIIPYLSVEKSKDFYCCTVDRDKVKITDNMVKVHVKYYDYATLVKVHDIVKEHFGDIINVYKASRRTLEIVSKSSSKLKGIQYLVKKLKLDESNIYTIGDGESDIEMINEYHGSVMSDSDPELLKTKHKKYNTVSDLITKIL